MLGRSQRIVVRGLWHGVCPVSQAVLPAYGYAKILPQMGFEDVPKEGYTPRKGDISVVPKNSNHVFGHIAVYNGQQWVSDFKQNTMLCSKTNLDNFHLWCWLQKEN